MIFLIWIDTLEHCQATLTQQARGGAFVNWTDIGVWHFYCQITLKILKILKDNKDKSHRVHSKLQFESMFCVKIFTLSRSKTRYNLRR